MKNTAILLVLFVLFTFNAFSQGINIFDIDTTNYPIIKAKFYAYDKDGKIQRPTKDQLKIIENGIERKIIDVSCPIKQPIAISSVLTFDVSGSMSSGPNGVANLDLAKTAAKSWIAALPTRESQAAITSFDHQNYIIQDFTRDNNKLLAAIEKLKPQGGTDYNKGFIEPMGGGILMAKTGRFKRVLIFLTDGQPNFEPEVQKIINEAKINNITIFAVTLGMTCPQNLKNISLQTSGYWYENVTTLQEAKDVYLDIMNKIQGNPCEISWESGLNCKSNLINLELDWLETKCKSSYYSSFKSIIIVNFNPSSSIVFRNKEINKKHDTTITIITQNSDIEIKNIISSNPNYDINPKSFALKKGELKELTISYTPIDSLYNFSSFTFINSVCDTKYYVSSFNKKITPQTQTLNLTHPNGGEVFVIGSDTNITWEGIPASDLVNIKLSKNNGKDWTEIANNVSNLKYKWENIPLPTNNTNLIKIEQNDLKINKTLDKILIGNIFELNNICWSPNRSLIAASSIDGACMIWDVNTGVLIFNLVAHLQKVNSICWSPDGSKIATSSLDRTIKIWDTNSGSLIFNLDKHKASVNSVSWSPDGTRIASASNDKTGKIWDTNTGELLFDLIGHKDQVNEISWAPFGNKVATASNDRTGKIWDVSNGKLIWDLTGNNYIVNSVIWSPDGEKIASVSTQLKIWNTQNGTLVLEIKETGQTVVWSPNADLLCVQNGNNILNLRDANTGSIVWVLDEHTSKVNSISWSTDGNKIATASDDLTGKIWDVYNGSKLLDLKGHNSSIKSIRWNPEGSKVATISNEKEPYIWNVELAPIQSDVSDAVFSIVAPEVKASDIDMKKQLVGDVKDSVIVGFIENIGSYKCRIDSIYFEGEQFDEFQVVSSIPVFTVDVSKDYNVEFRFKPKAVGIRKSTIVIISQADTLRYNITGEGIEPMVQVLNNFIDFGKVKVNEIKDSLQAQTIKNIGSTDLKITKIYQYGPNLTDFKEINDLKNYTLKSGEELKLDLSFKPTYLGRTSGTLMFEYEGIGSPAVVQLFGEGISNNPNCDGRGFEFKNFSSSSKIELVGSAELTNDSTVRLTDTKSNLVGGVTFGERLALRSSFEMYFSFRMSNGNNNQFIDGSLPGADGFAVLFQNGKNFRTTANGGSLGFNGIENCVALEIDMYKNDNPFFDPNGNHVALQVPKDNIITAEHSASRTVAMNDQIFILRPDSTVYFGKLVYDADKKQIQFFLDSTNKYNNLVLTADNFDFSQYLKLELGDFAHIGITSTTGAATQIHELLSWEFCSERDEFLSVEDRYYESEEVKQIDNILKLETGNIKEIEVMDITGKVLINKDINNNKINLNEIGISIGIYFMILKDDQNRRHFRKVNVVR